MIELLMGSGIMMLVVSLGVSFGGALKLWAMAKEADAEAERAQAEFERIRTKFPAQALEDVTGSETF